MTSATFDCRSYDVKAYALEIAKKRTERFSTVYACCFITSAEAAGVDDASSGGGQPADMLLSASSTGELRLYRLPDMVQRWTAGQQAAEACCSWGAHQGPVYCLAKAQAGSDIVLLSGGDDGYIRGWKLSDVLRRARQQQQHQQQEGQQQPGQQALSGGATAAPSSSGVDLQPSLAVRLPRAESDLAAMSLPPAVQTLSVAQGAGGSPALFVGCSDGGVHAVDLSSGAASQPQPTSSGHTAGVLAMDHHGPSSCLATGSEDGTIRLWDTRGGAAGARCCRILDASAGREVGPGAEALRCLRNPHVACLRFEDSGSWLMCGQGGGGDGAAGGGGAGAGNGGAGGGGSLSMWNLGMVQKARQVVTSFVPQAMALQPSEVLVVGSEAALSRYSLALERPTRQALATRSAFGLDCHPGSGAVAVGGVGASLELLSKYGKKTGGVYFQSDED